MNVKENLLCNHLSFLTTHTYVYFLNSKIIIKEILYLVLNQRSFHNYIKDLS